MPAEFTNNRPVALVTGGARRVGRAIALTLARAGCDVVVTYNTREGEAERVAKEVRATGVEGDAVPLRLDDLSALPAAAERLAASRPRWDVLVHNASEYRASPLEKLTGDRLVRDFAVHAAGPLLLTVALAPKLAASSLKGGGAVVAMADMHVLGRPRKELASYAMSKAALVEMVRTLARELAPRVRVNAVAPGVVSWPEDGPEADAGMQAAYLKRVPLARAGTPEDAADAVRWLALDAHYVTGEIVRVDGGRWLA